MKQDEQKRKQSVVTSYLVKKVIFWKLTTFYSEIDDMSHTWTPLKGEHFLKSSDGVHVREILLYLYTLISISLYLYPSDYTLTPML